MNSQRLLDAIEKTQQDLQELRELLSEIAKDRDDDFDVFFFQARRSFRYRLEHDTKSGKNVETSVMASYKEAMNRGLKGSLEQWRHLLQVGPVGWVSSGSPFYTVFIHQMKIWGQKRLK
jgi:hypothetical protein